MAAAWMLTEDFLTDILQQWQGVHSGQTFRLLLFKNDYVPVDGTVVGDLVECDFLGYVLQHFDPVDFAAATWTPFVAQMLLTVFVTFTASGSLSTPQTAYGYYVLDEDDNFQWAERWEVPFVFEASSILNIKPALRQRTCRES